MRRYTCRQPIAKMVPPKELTCSRGVVERIWASSNSNKRDSGTAMKTLRAYAIGKNFRIRNSIRLHSLRILLPIILPVLWLPSGLGAVPSLQWFGVQGMLFALDDQTNVYVNSFGPVVKLSPTGVPLQTNTICPIYARAQRDAAGNYYFADTFSPPRDFGGVTLTSGYMFAAKYSPAGALLWARNLGPGFANSIGVTDFKIEPGGTAYVGSYYCLGSSCSSANKIVDVLDTSGSNIWSVNLGDGAIQTSAHSVRLGVATSSNVCVLGFDGYGGGSWTLGLSRQGANPQGFGGSIQFYGGYVNKSYRAAHPVQNSRGQVYNVDADLLVKRDSTNGLLWSVNLGNSGSYTICADQFDGVHVADSFGNLRRFDFDGNEVWSLNTASSPVDEMLIDAHGNRFFSTLDRWVGRLGAEVVAAPQISTSPQGLTTFSGSNVVLTVAATGSGPLRIYWHRDGIFVPNGTNTTLNLPGATAAQSGNYTVVVSNFVNSVTSAPALVRIKAVQIFNGSQMMTNGAYNFLNPPTLSVRSAFASGSTFYTLDGSTPTFASTPYVGSITISSNATLRALGYSADFTQSEEADPVMLVFPPKYTLTATTLGPGSVTLNPPGGLYQASTMVTVTATPSAGWSFLHWTGDSDASSPSVNVLMDRNKTLNAVFGTTLSTTATGGGQVQKFPSFGTYPYGTTVRLTAIPDAGKYFGIWGNAGSGNSNPLYFTITNSTPTVSSLFAAVPEGQAALTVLINGPGSVNVSPPGNLFATDQTVSVTGTPFAGKGFGGWSGDASGTQNPLSLSMAQSRVVTANFLNWPFLKAGAGSVTPQGFRFHLSSGPGLVYEVFSSGDLSLWGSLGFVTNTTGEMEFTDPNATNYSTKFYKAVP